MRTNVYVDGFNLYYRALRGTPYRWLDLQLICRRLLPRNRLNRIRYFTALIQPRPGNPDQAVRQLTYIRALETIPNLTIHYGTFLSSVKRQPIASPQPGGPRTIEVLNTEEKGSDVNLATLLLCDGYEDDYEVGVIVSNDSDLLMPIDVVRNRLQKPIGILNPSKKPSVELRQAATFMKPIRAGALAASQFPLMLRDRNGIVTKPAGW